MTSLEVRPRTRGTLTGLGFLALIDVDGGRHHLCPAPSRIWRELTVDLVPANQQEAISAVRFQRPCGEIAPCLFLFLLALPQPASRTPHVVTFPLGKSFLSKCRRNRRTSQRNGNSLSRNPPQTLVIGLPRRVLSASLKVCWATNLGSPCRECYLD
ncbi:hypothetical protein EV126DRAFT_180384 [Verticillium dahliae]|nr:hypothetical protein EV126DRAFT_180384 [Verticillium dahliae]